MTINAFTLKELRQLVRTKSIAVSLITFLFVALAIAYAVPVFGGMRQNTGESMFLGINSLLALMLCVVLPSELFSFLDKERGSAKEHADFTMLTALPPSEVIDGKLRGAFAIMALFSTAALPFGVLSYLMHGITFLQMLRMLICTLCISCMLSHSVLVIAAMNVPRIVRRCIYALFLFATIAFLLAGGSVVREISASGSVLWKLVFVAVTVCMVARGLAISLFASSVMERDCPLRLSVLAATLGWLWFALVSRSGSAMLMWFVATTVGSLLLAAYSLAQPLGYSRRMLASRPRNLLLRGLFFPFSSAAVNGFVFACIIGAISVAVKKIAGPAQSPLADARATATFLMYAFSVLLFTRWVWRIFFSRRFPAILVPLLAGGLFVFLQTIPPYIGLGGDVGEFAATPFYCPGILAEPRTHLVQSAIAFSISFGLNFITSIIAAIIRARRK